MVLSCAPACGGVVRGGQVAAGQLGPVQAGHPGHCLARSVGTRLACQNSSCMRTCSSWMARSAAAPLRTIPHTAARPAPGGLANCHQDHLVSL